MYEIVNIVKSHRVFVLNVSSHTSSFFREVFFYKWTLFSSSTRAYLTFDICLDTHFIS